MNGIFLQLKKENTTFVSTDSHRLVRYSLEDVTSAEETEFILPSKAADQLKAILSQDNLPVQVQYNDSNALFAVQNITLVSRLIDETFPKYENVIPTDNELVLTIERAAMIS
jgi:DNA polymerase-3 subunit beta